MTPGPVPVVRLRQVSKSYLTAGDPVPVLREVDLTIGAGEKVSLIGPSGGGKSTLLALIAGLLGPSQGTIEIDGVAISDIHEGDRARLRAERIGIALQSDNLIPFLTARENVELALAFGGRRSRRAARVRAIDLLERFDVSHRAGHRPRHLSGGETQRVALAVAMANEPAIVLADEVVGQLDQRTAVRVLDEVLSADFAVLFVTHNIDLADQAGCRYTLVDGEIRPR